MTIQLKGSIFIAGVHNGAGTSLTLGADVEAELVNRGVAVFVGDDPAAGGLVPAMLRWDRTVLVDPKTRATTPLKPASSRILALGTSITNKFGTTFIGAAGDYSSRVVYAGSYLHWLCVEAGISPDNIINKGVSGNTSAMMVARYAADVAAQYDNFDILIFEPGPNDFSVGEDATASTASITADYQTIISAARGAGKRVIVLTSTPTEFGNSAAARNRFQACRQWLLDNYADDDYVRVVDEATAMADPATGGPLAALYLPITGTGSEATRVHPSMSGAQVMGRMIVQFAGDWLRDEVDTLRSLGKGDWRELLPNPRLAGGSAAAITTPFFQAPTIAGTGPDNTAIAVSGGTFTTATLAAIAPTGVNLPVNSGGVLVTLAGASADKAKAVVRFGSTDAAYGFTQVCRWDTAFANSGAVGVGDHRLLAAAPAGVLTCITAGTTAASGTPAPTAYGERVTSGDAIFVWQKKPAPGDIVQAEIEYELDSVAVGVILRGTLKVHRNGIDDVERFGYAIAGEFNVADADNPGLYMPRKGVITTLPVTLRDPAVGLRHVWVDLEAICANGGGCVLRIKNVNLRFK